MLTRKTDNVTHLARLSIKTELIPRRGLVHVEASGVTLHLDVANEDTWFELSPGYDKKVFLHLLPLLAPFGFELMDESDAIEFCDDGTIKQYIAQTWFPDEKQDGKVQAS